MARPAPLHEHYVLLEDGNGSAEAEEFCAVHKAVADRQLPAIDLLYADVEGASAW